jgi:hypothetical protein
MGTHVVAGMALAVVASTYRVASVDCLPSSLVFCRNGNMVR